MKQEKEKNKREKKRKEECVSRGLLLVMTFIDVDGSDVPFGAFYFTVNRAFCFTVKRTCTLLFYFFTFTLCCY